MSGDHRAARYRFVSATRSPPCTTSHCPILEKNTFLTAFPCPGHNFCCACVISEGERYLPFVNPPYELTTLPLAGDQYQGTSNLAGVGGGTDNQAKDRANNPLEGNDANEHPIGSDHEFTSL